MEGEIVLECDDVRIAVTVDDIRLLIIATCLAPNKWSVGVQNDRGISSVWHELFDSAQIAIQTAMRAIDEEGVGEFVDIEGFEYLDW